jgi:hypothetical protein
MYAETLRDVAFFPFQWFFAIVNTTLVNFLLECLNLLGLRVEVGIVLANVHATIFEAAGVGLAISKWGFEQFFTFREGILVGREFFLFDPLITLVLSGQTNRIVTIGELLEGSIRETVA